MRSISTIAGILMIVFGIFALTYQGFWYTKQEKVAQIGPMQVTANTEHPVYFPPFLGGLLIAGGIVVLVVGRINKK